MLLLTLDRSYKFEDVENGFCVWAYNKPPTYLQLIKNNTCFHVGSKPYNEEEYFCPAESARYGLYELGRILTSMASSLNANWKIHPEKNKKCEGFLRKWAQQHAGMAIARRVKERWQQLLTKVDPRVLAAQRSYFAACGKYHATLSNKNLYKQEHEHVVSDICKYRAAALAVNSMSVAEYGITWGRRHLGFGSSWTHIYCTIDGNINGPTRKILSNCPGAVPYHLLCNLSVRQPDRPLLNRTELLAYLTTVGFTNRLPYQGDDVERERNLRVIQNSNAKQICHAIHLIQEHQRQEVKAARKTGVFMSALRYIYDCTDTHNGHIVGLARKAIAWHRAGNYERLKRNCGIPPETATAKPTLALPENKNIKFLSSVAEVFDEGDRMGHCVAGYASRAVKGQSFLFHVDYRGKTATVEVSPDGIVIQSKGPHNESNAATKYGQNKLGQWAKGFPSSWNKVNHTDDEIPF